MNVAGLAPMRADREDAGMPAQLTCEHLNNPLGIGRERPLLGWTPGVVQTAWRIRASESCAALVAGAATRWDSGWTTDRRCATVWGGTPVASRERVWWLVEVRDAAGTVHSSDPAHFEAGLLSVEDWDCGWIGCPAMRHGRALLFRTLFSLDRAVVRARLYVAGVGLYEPRLNGSKVGDRVLEPPPVTWTRRVPAAAYDVTEAVQPRGNVLGAIVGHGWAGQRALLMRLEISHSDGPMTVVATASPYDGSWLWQVREGQYLADSLFDGEEVDQGLEPRGWDAPGARTGCDPAEPRTRQWMQAYRVPGPGGEPVFTAVEPMRVVATSAPVSTRRVRPGLTIVDTGQNLAGWVRLAAMPAGSQAVLRHGEFLDADGQVDQTNLYQAAATDRVVFAEGGGDYEPRFTYHGFRHVAIEHPSGVEPRVSICRVRSDLARRGDFTCSDPTIAAIHRLVVATEESNLHGVPTDCPQRPERQGWLNDFTARGEELVHNFNCAAFLNKWLDDISDVQDRLGRIPDTVPHHWGRHPADPLCIAPVSIPWLLWRHFGDSAVIDRHWPLMTGWVDYLATRRDAAGIIHDTNWGDWAAPAEETVAGSIGGSAISARTPGALVSTGHFVHMARMLARLATVSGRVTEAAQWTTTATQAAGDFHRAFFFQESGRCGYGSGNQACNALALALELVPATHIPAVAAALAAEVAGRGNRLSTGNICTKYLLEALTRHGHHDVAVAVACQHAYPSWGHMLDHGATTVWERWEHLTTGGMNSHNHPMLGSCGAWFYHGLVGLRDDVEAEPGTRWLLTPGVATGVDAASAELPTMRGRLSVSWRRTNEALAVEVVVPPGVEVMLAQPHGYLGEARTLAAGRWEIHLDLDRSGQAAAARVGLGSK